MNTALCFDDVLIVPKFSNIETRTNCDTKVHLNGLTLDFGILSSNMDTITESKMANTMIKNGGIGVLHRFMSIEQNIDMFLQAPNSIVSLGVGIKEQTRAIALKEAGCNKWMIDVAHGASFPALEMYKWLRSNFKNDWICVGNFATRQSFNKFVEGMHYENYPNAIKVGIGGGSMCTTRIVTGCGLPTLQSLLDFQGLDIAIIADGGIRNSGDIAKCYAAGARAVMIGSLLSGTYETPGEIVYKSDYSGKLLTKEEALPRKWVNGELVIDETKEVSTQLEKFKKYRGSASKESYAVQGKEARHRTAEGESTLVPYKGSADDILEQLKAGLKSAMSYVGVDNLRDFSRQAELVRVTINGVKENGSHGKN